MPQQTVLLLWFAAKGLTLQSTMMPTKPLSGKSVLVTGGARRIGREIALALGQAGAKP
jgi:FlaA1/EpsC-like NDP-sugar epimerase